MGEVFIRRITDQDKLWLCDDCGQQGIRANGKDIMTSEGEFVMWLCYNCVEKVKRHAV
jgi:ribosomal protein L37AE/L43A